MTQRPGVTYHKASPKGAQSNYDNLQPAHIITKRWTKERNKDYIPTQAIQIQKANIYQVDLKKTQTKGYK